MNLEVLDARVEEEQNEKCSVACYEKAIVEERKTLSLGYQC